MNGIKEIIDNYRSADYLLIYHKEDNDGVFSCAIFKMYLEKNFPDSTVITCGESYNSMAKVTTEDIDILRKNFNYVIIVDLAFTPKLMSYFRWSFGNNMTWIDHHGPAIASSVEYKYDDISGVRQTDRSALLLTYKYCFDPLDIEWNKPEHGNVPSILQVLSAWDSFTFDREGFDEFSVRSVNEGTTYLFNLEEEKVFSWLSWLYNVQKTHTSWEKELFHLKAIGETIVRYKDRMADNLIETVGDNTWTLSNGNTVTVLFMQGQTSSLWFAKANTTHGAVFKRLPEGNWVLSLYNVSKEETFHCGEYLKKKYKGGGHVGAAGCQLTEKQFVKMLKTKVI